MLRHLPYCCVVFSDIRLASALRRIHHDPSGGVSVKELAETSAMSRSAFFDRFRSQFASPSILRWFCPAIRFEGAQVTRGRCVGMSALGNPRR